MKYSFGICTNGIPDPGALSEKKKNQKKTPHAIQYVSKNKTSLTDPTELFAMVMNVWWSCFSLVFGFNQCTNAGQMVWRKLC